jgi:hypothetical protein
MLFGKSHAQLFQRPSRGSAFGIEGFQQIQNAVREDISAIAVTAHREIAGRRREWAVVVDSR